MAINFLATFLAADVIVHEVHLCTFYVALSSLTLPLRQRIRPFTANKALSGPPLHRDRTRASPVGGSRVVCAGSGFDGVDKNMATHTNVSLLLLLLLLLNFLALTHANFAHSLYFTFHTGT